MTPKKPEGETPERPTAGRLRSEWMELVFFANDIAMAYRLKNEQLRGEIAKRDRQIEMYQKFIADFERQKPA
jgi:hypothetical protein